MKPLRLARVILASLLLIATTCTEWNDMPQAPCSGGARIFGVVTGGSGPIAGVDVMANSISGTAAVQAETEADGTYELLVPSGEYFVRVISISSYRDFYYSASGPKIDWDEADTLDVSEGDGGRKPTSDSVGSSSSCAPLWAWNNLTNTGRTASSARSRSRHDAALSTARAAWCATAWSFSMLPCLFRGATFWDSGIRRTELCGFPQPWTGPKAK